MLGETLKEFQGKMETILVYVLWTRNTCHLKYPYCSFWLAYTEKSNIIIITQLKLTKMHMNLTCISEAEATTEIPSCWAALKRGIRFPFTICELMVAASCKLRLYGSWITRKWCPSPPAFIQTCLLMLIMMNTRCRVAPILKVNNNPDRLHIHHKRIPDKTDLSLHLP